MLTEITTLEDRQRELSTPSALRGLIEPGADVTQRWAAAPMSTRRDIARVLLTPDLTGELRLNPTPGEGDTAHQHRTAPNGDADNKEPAVAHFGAEFRACNIRRFMRNAV